MTVQSSGVDLRPLLQAIELHAAENAEVKESFADMEAMFRGHVKDIGMDILRTIAILDGGDVENARKRLLETCNPLQDVAGSLLRTVKH